MKLLKKSERTINAKKALTTYKKIGFTVENLGEFRKWKELPDGRIAVKMTVYKVENEDCTAYFLEDILGRFACEAVTDAKEVFDWLKEKGYKTDKEFYLNDYGMDEETWEEWNKGF